MTKKTRLEKAWSRNSILYQCKGVYFCIGQPIKNCPTPRQVLKILRKEEISTYGMTLEHAEQKGIIKFWKPDTTC